ncbi:MAG: hypothetical protein JJ992_12075 [Planctomycetes bacterium]|nr:hypothetical protein [Planctomycetota bacterium]
MVTCHPTNRQIPLIHVVESDDLFLADQPDVLWFDVLRSLDYHPFQATAAHYYEHLYTFNQQQKQRRIERRENQPDPNPETPGQATQRLLAERATLDKQCPALYQRPQPATPLIQICPQEVAPGVTPPRFVGRPAKCFFSMLYAFLGTTLAGQRAEPQFVSQRLRENPAFARTCGFTIRRPGKPERQSDVPSLRKLQQFDQIMTDNGLWEELAVDRVAANLRAGKIEMEATLVHDTTHYHAYSSMRVVDLPPSAEADAAENATSCQDSPVPARQPSQAVPTVKVRSDPVAVARVKVARVPAGRLAPAPDSTVPVPADLSGDGTSEADTAVSPGKTAKTPRKPGVPKGKSSSAKTVKNARKKKRKSHPRTTKNCRCQDREHCDHEWINADLGAGTVVKSSGKMYWGHKASTLSLANQEVLLDAVAMSDAASHDSQSVVPHLNRLFSRHPDLRGQVKRLLDDGAADDSKLKATVYDTFGIELLAPINPRRRKPIRDNLPRGMDHLTPRGVPVCRAGYPFDLLGFRQDTERFLFQAPQDREGESVCVGCSQQAGCYRGDSGGRVVTISPDRVPWLDRDFPQLSKRFAKTMARRTSIERLHKLMKFDLGDDRLTKRGNSTFQACLDKTLFAMHVLLSHEG